MKKKILELKDKILNSHNITYEEAKMLIEIPTTEMETINLLLESANEIREEMCGNYFDLCTILNAKSGRCSENCRYCAQSVHFKTNADVYDLVSKEYALCEARKMEAEGAHRFSLVTSGRGLNANDSELAALSNIYEFLNSNSNIALCASHGICSKEALIQLKESGVSTYHHNLESSRAFYPKLCTTHTYDDRLNTVKYAQEIGLKVCSGGIFGLGETPIDRLDMAFELKALNIRSVPINILTPIAGTPMENNEAVDPLEILKTIAVYRFILPKASIRYAGGRTQLGQHVKLGLQGGVNSALTGNFLTTTGGTIKEDQRMVRELGYEF